MPRRKSITFRISHPGDHRTGSFEEEITVTLSRSTFTEDEAEALRDSISTVFNGAFVEEIPS